MNDFRNKENNLNVLRKVVKNPHTNQRQLALDLGFSLGKLNYCLKALKEKGLVKIQNFSKNTKKTKYLYYCGSCHHKLVEKIYIRKFQINLKTNF